MTKGPFLALALILLSPLSAGSARSAELSASVVTEHATVTLLGEQPRGLADQTLWLGLHFELIPHWHVYWRNPGASGSAPVIRWTLPEGWQAGEIQWPVPKRIRVGPLVNYGYEGAVTLLVPVRVPGGARQTGALSILAEADWLVCREECVPETGRFALALEGPATGSRPDNAELFATARSQWPTGKPIAGFYQGAGDSLSIRIDRRDLIGDQPDDVWFAANAWGPVDPSGAQRWRAAEDGLVIEVAAGDVPLSEAASLEGLLVVESSVRGDVARRGFHLQLAPMPTSASPASSTGLAPALIFALLGGLILNVMPCVLPVLGIKVLGFVKEAGEKRHRLAGHGLAYAAGVLFSFALLASALLTLRAGGESLGWGFQLQSPVLVALLAYLMLLVGLNLSGVFTLGSGLMGAGQSLTAGRGLANTFAVGVLAAVVASPCTAPFMGSALGFAITRPITEAMLIFLALGAGFALPVLLLSLLPAWVRFLPRPGPWMKAFQQALAFPMYATAAWLLWVLSQQTDARGYGAALAGLVLLALAAWLYGRWQPSGWRLGLLGIGATALMALAVAPLTRMPSSSGAAALPEYPPWSEQRVQELLAEGRPVFVNFTAAWCITCKVNERVALATRETRELFESRDVAYLVADWTRRDPKITRQLERHGRSGVPLYLLYSPSAGQPRVLPQLLTEGLIADVIQTL